VSHDQAMVLLGCLILLSLGGIISAIELVARRLDQLTHAIRDRSNR
jgi:hypothetical protein